jgi:hypothetical protein
VVQENITVNGRPLVNCPTRKVPHASGAAAEAHANSILKKDGHLPNIYSCQECGYLHVGGGRRSDQPIRRPVQIATPRPVFVPKKIDKGHDLGLEELILEKLRTTYLADEAMARQVGCNYNTVYDLRHKHNIPTGPGRKHKVVADMLAVNPGRNRHEIAKALKVTWAVVENVALKLGLKGVPKANSIRRGVKNFQFKLTSAERRKRRRSWSPDWTPERRAGQAAKSRAKWADPVIRARMLAAMPKNNLPPQAFKGHHHTGDSRQRMSQKQQERFKDPGAREQLSDAVKKTMAAPEFRQRRSVAAKAYLNKPEVKAKHAEARKKFWESPAGLARKQALARKMKDGAGRNMRAIQLEKEEQFKRSSCP